MTYNRGHDASTRPGSAPARFLLVQSASQGRWRARTVAAGGGELQRSGVSEDADPNPFRDYRLSFAFEHAASGTSVEVPGYFAADGDAAESSASAGGVWRAVLLPSKTGEWTYRASFRTGPDVALSEDLSDGAAAGFDGASGSFTIHEPKGDAPGFYAQGLLEYTGERYLRFAGSGRYFLKGGADSPENFLGYADFDQTYDADAGSGSYEHIGQVIHHYEPHVQDWKPGDPTWQGGKGKGIIGALNYLASKGMNSVYFLTYNLDGGDGRDVWPWSDLEVRHRYDVSKLDQWEVVFRHMDRLGLMLHVVTQETENDHALGGGPGLNDVRKLYLRELIARFAHHPAVVWNLGEENNTPDADRKAIAAYIRALDPYDHPITVHTHANKADTFYDGILGDPNFEATSIQSLPERYYQEAFDLARRSAEAGRQWVIFHDEQNPASDGVLPDADDPDHDTIRTEALWGNLMGGGAGVEWYFGHQYPHMDINMEDWRSRDRMWDQTRYALEFFREHLPFWEMTTEAGRILRKGDEILAVQLPKGGTTSVRLGEGDYQVQWFDPRTGGDLIPGSGLSGPGEKRVGPPPSEPGKDWVALLTQTR
ncbi:MAG: DUF5060 domain-containing protein [Bryobacterales bacterium]